VSLLKSILRFAFMKVEWLFDRIFTKAWNPFYYLGALGYFYFWVVSGSGLYLYIFFDTGLTEAYDSIEYMTHEQWYLAGVMRSLHRYASDALVVMAMLHLLREFAFDRYRGGRWFSWMTGVPMIWMIFAAGVTGYWLVWDELAQYVAISSTEWLDWLPIFGEPVARNFMSASHLDDRFFTLMIFIHIAVPLILLFIMWFHLQRINYAKVNPERGLAIGTMLMLLVLSFIKPAISHGPADLATVPGSLNIDWFYLWAYPMIEATSQGTVWGFAFFGTILLFAIPWLPPRRKRAVAEVHLENCNGCTRCVVDCPFNAVSMKKRSDGSPFNQEAVVDPDMCVSCGICVGSCPTATPFRRRGELIPGIEMPELTVADMRKRTEQAAAGLKGNNRILAYGCEHAIDPKTLGQDNLASVIMPCVAMLPPSFIDFVLSRDLADGVLITGCRDGECHYRLGARWMEERIAGDRDPRLRKRVDRSRVRKVWAAPTDRKFLSGKITDFASELEKMESPGKGPGPEVAETKEPVQ
jgi:quinol-cytochrome oxidoreductase complex cytochrome b subunit/coenzyme F420-reducing hydrogenase delta subunit